MIINARRTEIIEPIPEVGWELPVWRDDGSDPHMLGELLSPHGIPRWCADSGSCDPVGQGWR